MFTINIMKLFVSMTSANVHRFMFIVPDIIKKNGQLICNLYMLHVDHTGVQFNQVQFSQWTISHKCILASFYQHIKLDTKKNDVTMH